MSQQLRQTQRMTLSQKLVMTPMMQQAIKLLQLSTLELQELIQQEISENIFLEEEAIQEQTEAAEGNETPLESEQLSLAEGNGNNSEETDLTKGELVSSPEMEEYFADTNEYNDYAAPSTFEATYDDYEPQMTRGETLKETLLRQLHILATSERDIEIGERLIDQINDDGYFTSSIEAVAEETGAELAEVARVLQLVQSFEPAGVGARNIKECLLIQYRAREERNPLLYQAINAHLEDLERKRYAQVARSLGVTVQQAQELADTLAMFEPYPGRAFGDAPAEYVTPDVYIEKVGGEWQVRVNDDGTPPLRISRRYRRMLQDRDSLTQEEYEFIAEKFRSARWLIRNIEQRKQTLYKVTKYIADVQRDFLEHGITHLRPLRYRDVADGVGIHEATVCRVVNSKYVQTPRGLFELKFFFSTGLEGALGDDQSAKSVMVKIEELIEKEDPKHPLSDQKITNMLASQIGGVNMSRRTVAKYRKKMGILPAHQRKRV